MFYTNGKYSLMVLPVVMSGIPICIGVMNGIPECNIQIVLCTLGILSITKSYQ